MSLFCTGQQLIYDEYQYYEGIVSRVLQKGITVLVYSYIYCLLRKDFVVDVLARLAQETL